MERDHIGQIWTAQAQSDLICAPRPIIIDQTQAAQRPTATPPQIAAVADGSGPAARTGEGGADHATPMMDRRPRRMAPGWDQPRHLLVEVLPARPCTRVG